MTILVTGATGTIGRQVVRQLAEAGHRVRALTRTPETAVVPNGVEVVGGDLARPATLASALSGVTAMHLISIGGDDYAPLRTGDEIMAMAGAAGVGRVTVLTGSDDELAVLRAVTASGVSWTHVRPLEFMANKLAWGPSIAQDGTVAAFGEAPMAIVHEADVAAVVVAGLTADGHHGATYSPTGPAVLSRPAAAATIGEVIGRTVRFSQLTRAQARAGMLADGVLPEVADYVLDYEANPPPEAAVVSPVVAEVTGRPPRRFAEWVAEHAAAFRPKPSEETD